MKTIYLDNNFKCHIENDGTMIAVETDFFDGKCNAFIEGYRFVPMGESWTRYDGVVFHGEMIAPWKDIKILESIQNLYKETATAEAQADTDALLVDHEYRLTMLELGLVE